jgi:hypothetical protein
VLPQHLTLYPLPARLVQGRRLKTAPESQLRQASPAMTLREDQIRPNLDNIINIRAVNFAQFYKQKGVKVIRIYIAELVELVEQEERKQLINKLLTGLVKILDLIKESFCCLVNGNYIIKEACKVFPNYFYYFLKENL